MISLRTTVTECRHEVFGRLELAARFGLTVKRPYRIMSANKPNGCEAVAIWGIWHGMLWPVRIAGSIAGPKGKLP